MSAVRGFDNLPLVTPTRDQIMEGFKNHRIVARLATEKHAFKGIGKLQPALVSHVFAFLTSEQLFGMQGVSKQIHLYVLSEGNRLWQGQCAKFYGAIPTPLPPEVSLRGACKHMHFIQRYLAKQNPHAAIGRIHKVDEAHWYYAARVSVVGIKIYAPETTTLLSRLAKISDNQTLSFAGKVEHVTSNAQRVVAELGSFLYGMLTDDCVGRLQDALSMGVRADQFCQIPSRCVRTPLHVAVLNCCPKGLELLLDTPGTDPQIRDAQGNTCLELALRIKESGVAPSKCFRHVMQQILTGSDRQQAAYYPRPNHLSCLDEDDHIRHSEHALEEIITMLQQWEQRRYFAGLPLDFFCQFTGLTHIPPGILALIGQYLA